MSDGIPETPAVRASAREWVAYDLAVRRVRYWIPDPWSVPEQPPDPEVALCHGDGRVREAALRGEVPARLLPLVVLRCADWAGPVREVAREVLERTPTAALADVAHVVLRAAARGHGGYGLRLLEGRLAAGDAAWRVLEHPTREVRRWSCQQAVENGWLAPQELADLALRDDDVLVQTLAAEAALAGDAVPRVPLEKLLAARAPRVRAVAVTALRRAGTPERGAAWLDDRSASVRTCAQWAVRVSGGDPAAHYREALAAGTGRAPLGAVAGIGECGPAAGADAGELVTPYLADPRPGVRAAAVGALGALGVVGPGRIAHLLDDPSAGVVRRTARALTDDADMLPLDGPAGLLTRLGPDRAAHVRRAAFRLLAARNGLPPLRAALTRLDDPEVGRSARALAARWAPSDSAALAAALPTDERARLAAEIEAAAPVLGERVVRFLRWILKLRAA